MGTVSQFANIVYIPGFPRCRMALCDITEAGEDPSIELGLDNLDNVARAAVASRKIPRGGGGQKSWAFEKSWTNMK